MTTLRKDQEALAHAPSAQVTTPSQGQKPQLSAPAKTLDSHPLFSGAQTVGMISGESPRWPTTPGLDSHEAMGRHLQQLGLKFEETKGRYETPERSYIVYGPTREQMFELGQKFGQDSVVFSQGGRHEMMFTNGPKAGRFHSSLPGYESFDEAPEDYYTWVPSHNKFMRLSFDWDSTHPAPLQEPHASAALQLRAKHSAPGAAAVAKSEYTVPEIRLALAQRLRKFIEGPALAPHPHFYPWHNPHTTHHLRHAGHGVLVSRQLAKSYVTVDQLREVARHSDYAKHAVPFGTLQPGQSPNPHLYPLAGKSAQVDQIVRDHGYQIADVGGRFGRPDFAERNYDTKHLPIWDSSHPHPEIQEQTRNWRKLHELAHALTHADVNQIYGEGRRVGELGRHRNLHESLRSVHWEWLAAHKQRALAQAIGIDIPDPDFNRELNTIMHDAVHRTATGDAVDPGTRGFVPHSHPVPLETALGLVREHAHNLGVQGTHDLLGKNEGSTAVADEKMVELSELKKALADVLKKKVADYEKSLLELRKRELAKAEKIGGGDRECPKCGLDKNESNKEGCKCEVKKGEISGVLPGDKKVKEIEAPGSGGQKRKLKIPSGRKLKKADVPVAKPPTKNPVATPTSQGMVKSEEDLKKGDFGMTDSGKVSTTPGAGPAPAAKPKFGLADLAAGKQKLQAAGVQPASKLGLPKPPKPGVPAQPPAGVSHLSAPPKLGEAPKIPAAAAAPGTPAPKAGLLDRFKGARKPAAPAPAPAQKSEPEPAKK